MAGYARLSNDFWQDEDVSMLRRQNPAAALLFVLAISWCSDHSSDGRISRKTLLYVLNASDEDVETLAESGLIVADEAGSVYTLRSYLKYQNSAEDIKAKAEANRERVRRWREARKTEGNGVETDNQEPGNDDVMHYERSGNGVETDNQEPGNDDVMHYERSGNGVETDNQEPITNNQKNSSNEEFSLPQTPSQAEGAAERADEDYPIEFEQFWQTYPRKTGKRKAYAAWRKARRKTNNTFLIAKASRYAADPNREPGYTLTPANWLDGEHWDDDPLPAKPEPTARPSPSAWNRSQANQDANAALIAHYAAEEATENQSREGVLTC